MNTITPPYILFERIHPMALLPHRATGGSIGLDIHALCVGESGRTNTVIIGPRSSRNIRTGLLIQPPEGFYIQVCSRSGLAAKNSVFVTNAPGIIDPDYRGELHVLLYNGGHEAFYVHHEMRIAQLILAPAHFGVIAEGKVEPNTERGVKGFGSTGS